MGVSTGLVDTHVRFRTDRDHNLTLTDAFTFHPDHSSQPPTSDTPGIAVACTAPGARPGTDAFAAVQLRAELAVMPSRREMHDVRVQGGRYEIDLVIHLGRGRVFAIEEKAGAAPSSAVVGARRHCPRAIWICINIDGKVLPSRSTSIPPSPISSHEWWPTPNCSRLPAR